MKSISNIALKLVMLTFTLCSLSEASAKSPPPGSGTSDVPANILLLMDTSGSMDEIVTEGDSRYPVDVVFDSEGNIYVAKFYDEIEKYDSSGNYLKTIGGYTSNKTNGMFDGIYALAIDSSDNLYVADYNNGRIQKLDSEGNFITKYTLQDDTAYGVALDSSGNVYAMNGAGNVEKFSNAGSRLLTFSSTNGRYIAINGSNQIYITQNSSSRIRRYDTSGNLQSTYNLSYKPLGIRFDSTGSYYVTDNTNSKVYKYNSSNSQTNSWGSSGTGNTQFKNPRGIGIRSDNTAYIADYNNHRVKTVNGAAIINNGNQKTRLQVMQSVIKKIVSDSNLTSGANFGLMTWNSNATMRVNVSASGAQTIYNSIDSYSAGGNTILDNAMTLASNYFNGSSSPIINGASCQQNIIIVISDGYWTDTTASNTAQTLYNNKGIKTFAIGFTTTDSDSYITLSTKGGSYPDSPLYADNEEALLDVLSAYIRQIISTQLTFTVPTIIPGITNGDHILQSTFLFKEFHQWKGHLYKYALNNDGTIGSLLWDAGSMLNAKPAASRNIWTVGTGIAYSLNNFTVTNLNRLKIAMEENAGTTYTDDDMTKLINFTRGIDSYSEYPNGQDDENDTLLTGERWKLSDIYHSRAIAVGAPSSYVSDSVNTNSESYYRYTNGYNAFKQSSLCGTVCNSRSEVVYVGSNSGMLHAFNSSTGDELWSFIPPSILPSLRNIITNNTGKTASIYGVDSSPIVKDIYYGGTWKTILISGLRQGGNSYFALDITNPTAPKHLFTISNNTIRSKVSYWDANGTKTDYNWNMTSFPAAYDFRALGESWSEPVIMNIPIGSVKKWVAVFGGGYNNNVSTAYGNNAFVIDLEDGGKIIQKISIPDTDGSNSIISSVPANPIGITSDTTTTFTKPGGFVYFSDLEGKLWKINLTNQGTLYETTRVFETESTFDNDRLTYQQLTPSVLSNGKLISFYGTGDMQRVGRTSSTIANRAYGIYDENYPNFTAVTPNKAVNLLQLTSTSAVCPSATQKGWYFNLNTNEKITAQASIRAGTVIFSRYTPDSNNICDSGTGKISEHDFVCGTNLRETSLGAGMPTEAIVYKDKLYIGISSDTQNPSALPSGFVKTGNLIVGTPVSDAPTNVRIENWREEY